MYILYIIHPLISIVNVFDKVKHIVFTEFFFHWRMAMSGVESHEDLCFSYLRVTIVDRKNKLSGSDHRCVMLGGPETSVECRRVIPKSV